MQQKRLPADSGAMTLGIIALSITLVGFCCGLFALVALAMSIVGLLKANKSIALYRENQELYLEQSYKNVNTGRILNIIAVPISAIVSLIMLTYYLIYGVAILAFFGLMSSAIQEGQSNSNKTDNDYYEEEIDTTTTWEDDDYIIELENDSIT
ncbi:hypothetical protein [Winogradskyella sp. UBA3174]|uniref:hypothetical protein n=1 Tax=Winogradskyella sp. UBA3174 TaxID=1947785 RepID=UPI0025FD8433|nr:hypothetical protein [Winogradskyella sp. UBA3174]|tara:strand:+ start:1513 stop:1971 length:459 start_codon:yes stop_codon:yes gene_type:complete